MKKWIVLETFFLTLLPSGILIYSAPFLLFGLVEVFFPVSSDMRSVHERMWGMLPYIGGLFGIGMLWRYGFQLARKQRFNIGWLFAVIVSLGGLASKEVLSISNLAWGIIICLPPWILVVHFLYLRFRMSHSK